MELFLADYDPLLSYFHSASAQITTENYLSHNVVGEDTRIEERDRLEYARLFTEIEFLVRHWDPQLVPNPVLVVQGSFPNAHYLLLSQLFPSLSLELWDFRNVQTPIQVQETRSITLYHEDLDENQALDLYRNRDDVLFLCYVEPSAALNKEEKFLNFWNEKHAFQANLVRAMEPRLCNLTFSVPLPALETTDYYRYFRGFITPCFLSPLAHSDYDRICRCVTILQGTTKKEVEIVRTEESVETIKVPSRQYVRCDYSPQWFTKVLNFWNLAAKKGKLLRNPITRSSYVNTNRGFLYCGLEICRVLDVLARYLHFALIVDETSIDVLVLEKVTSLLEYFQSTFEEMGVQYSLVEHSQRYRPPEMTEGIVSAPLREQLVFPEALTRARALLESPEETVTDLTL